MQFSEKWNKRLTFCSKMLIYLAIVVFVAVLVFMIVSHRSVLDVVLVSLCASLGTLVGGILVLGIVSAVLIMLGK